ncbi:hypothetical protein O181_026940 [Austropuccinia psidii MF-1]|uniref:FAS1 domain-containing protein n=1 Tax=Austropuccinia psidii MF-1 TaxID=1389203 RepID=A0A9Q3H2P3_9BASI|nr:hypothetical protein [Austropuccinia psidii MF-1]
MYLHASTLHRLSHQDRQFAPNLNQSIGDRDLCAKNALKSQVKLSARGTRAVMRPSLFLCALTALVGHSPKPITGSPSLLFQLEPNPDASSFEVWSDAQTSSSFPSDHPNTKEYAPIENQVEWYQAFSLNDHRPSALSVIEGLLTSISSAGNRLSSFPWRHAELPPVNLTQYTIWEVLSWVLKHPSKSCGENNKHVPPLHRVAWLANLSQPIQNILSDPNLDLTFFAPDDQALTPPKKRRGSLGEGQTSDDSHELYWQAFEALEDARKFSHLTSDHETDKDKKEFLIKLVAMVLKHHISPKSQRISEIHAASTIPSVLKILPSEDAPAFRLRVGRPLQAPKPGKLTLNFFTQVDATRYRPLLTKNGVIYIASRAPLFPPFSPLAQLFLFPKYFAGLTSAIQQVRLDDQLLPHWGKKTIDILGKPSAGVDKGVSLDDTDLDLVDERVQNVIQSLVEENPSFSKRSFTVFAPNNLALASLGPHLTAFLFSPFGARILRYILAYHLVPDVIWHTDHIDNITDHKSIITRYESGLDIAAEWPGVPSNPRGLPPLLPNPSNKVNITEFSLPTLLGSRKNESLEISLVEFKPPGSLFASRRVFIKQHGPEKSSFPPKNALPVRIADVTAWGGAIHVVPQLIRPPIPQEHRGRKDVERAIELSLFQAT